MNNTRKLRGRLCGVQLVFHMVNAIRRFYITKEDSIGAMPNGKICWRVNLKPRKYRYWRAQSTRLRKRLEQFAWQVQQEMRWLAEHRHEYSGKWIALRGEHLLAAGATAEEVFSKVTSQDTLPFVIRVDEEELPFAGW